MIEEEGHVAGYFAFVMDDDCHKQRIVVYGRMTALAMDASKRGKGLGASLFRSVISIIGENGGQYVASEYP